MNSPRTDENFVAAKAYLSWSAVRPEDNWFVVMVSELTLAKVLHILSEDVPEVAAFAGMPSRIGASGIYPLKTGGSCTQLGDGDTKTVGLDKDCFAFFSMNPSTVAHTLTFAGGNDITIAPGVALGGRLQILDFVFSIEARFSKLGLYINANMGVPREDGVTYDPLRLRIGGTDLVTLGRERVGGVVVGGPTFLVDVSKTRALVDIRTYVDIPILKTHGSLLVAINDVEFRCLGSLALFGLFTINVEVQWSWDMTSFRFAMTDSGLSIGGGVSLVNLDVLSFVYSASQQLARVDAQITVLDTLTVSGFVAIGASDISFGVSGSVLGSTVSVLGSASLTLLVPQFTLRVTVSMGAAMRAVGEAVWGGLKAAGAALETAWNYVGQKVAVILGKISAFFSTTLAAFATGITNLLNGIGDIAGQVVEALKTVPLVGDLIQLGEDLVSGVVSVVDAIFKRRNEREVVEGTNTYGCEILRRKWEKCLLFCWTEQGKNTYNNATCMDIFARDAKVVEGLADTGAAKEALTQENKAGNAAYAKVLDPTYTPPDPVLMADPEFVLAPGADGVVGTTVDVSTVKLTSSGVSEGQTVSGASFGVDFRAGSSSIADQAAASLGASLKTASQNGVQPQFTSAYLDEADTTFEAYVPVVPLLEKRLLNQPQSRCALRTSRGSLRSRPGRGWTRSARRVRT